MPIPVQAALDDALAGGDADALTRLPNAIVGRVAYQVLAGLTEPGRARRRNCAAARRTGWVTSSASGRRERPAGGSDSGIARPVAVIGPTGTGKSRSRWRSPSGSAVEIVNADAMQLYRGMDIGTAKLPLAERRGVPHHQLDVLDVTETATVARYQQAAVADVEAIAARGAVPVIVGGSMMYIQSLLDEWAFPATDPPCEPAGSSGWQKSVWPTCTRSWPGATRPPRRRSWPPTADASCARWRWSS